MFNAVDKRVAYIFLSKCIKKYAERFSVTFFLLAKPVVVQPFFMLVFLALLLAVSCKHFNKACISFSKVGCKEKVPF